ncbi:hypothetical protein ACMYSQ_005474 [Aspergillus niger]
MDIKWLVLLEFFLLYVDFSGDCSWRARASHQKKGGFFPCILRPNGDWSTQVMEGKFFFLAFSGGGLEGVCQVILDKTETSSCGLLHDIHFRPATKAKDGGDTREEPADNGSWQT